MKTAGAALLLIAGLGIAAGQETQGPVRVAKAVLASKNTFKSQPEYPQAAKNAGVEGTVVLEVLISKEGRIDQVTVLEGPELLRESAISAVSQWTYQPTLLNGVPVEVISQVEVNYRLL